MEATDEVEGMILEKILPPRLEEAGLEDCALPPESIMEAFAKAASAVRSVLSASSDDDVDKAEGPCANDPWPAVGEGSSDALVGICDGVGDVPGSCSNEKGGGVSEVAGDEIAVEGEDEKADELVVGGAAVPESGEQACVDGLKGLEIGEKSKGTLEKKPSNGDDDSEEKVPQIPILTEGYV